MIPVGSSAIGSSTAAVGRVPRGRAETAGRSTRVLHRWRWAATTEPSGGGVRRRGLGACAEVSGGSCVAHTREEVYHAHGSALHI
jgi:hypothetical protein